MKKCQEYKIAFAVGLRVLGSPNSEIYSVIIIIAGAVGSRYHVFLKMRLSGSQNFQGYIIWVRKNIGFKAIPNSSISKVER